MEAEVTQDKLNKYISHVYTDTNKAVIDLTKLLPEAGEDCIPVINTNT